MQTPRLAEEGPRRPGLQGVLRKHQTHSVLEPAIF